MLHASHLEAGAAQLRRAIDLVRTRYFAGLQNVSDQFGNTLDVRRLIELPSAPRSLRACDLKARLKSGMILIEELANFYAAHLDDHTHTYMGTFAWDLGVSKLKRPVIRLKAIRARIDKMMRRHGLDGVYFVEPDIILAHSGQRTPRLHMHVHMACWHKDRPLRPKKLAAEIMATHDLPNSLSARSVVFTRRPMTPENVVKLGAYLTKIPACVKQRRPRRKGGGYKLTNEQAKFSPRMVVRMVEILSQLTIYECLGGVGQGKEITRPWHRRLLAWANERERKFLRAQYNRRGSRTTVEAAKFWDELRAAGRSKRKAVKVKR